MGEREIAGEEVGGGRNEDVAMDVLQEWTE